MAKKKDNLSNSSVEELKKQLGKIEEDLRSIKWKAEGSKSKNVKEEATIKKDIARIMTAIKAKK